MRASEFVTYFCERELDALDSVINVKKTCCLRIGPRIVMSLAMDDCDKIFSCTHC